MTYKCPEELEEMQKSSCGFYCESCKKEVFDFRGLSRARIKQITREKNVQCGIFDPEVAVASHRSVVQTIFRVAFTAVFLLGLNAATLFAQTKVHYDSTKVTMTTESSEKVLVKGVLKDHRGKPLEGTASYVVGDTEFKFSTNSEGEFEFEIDTVMIGHAVNLYFVAEGKRAEHIYIEDVEARTYWYEIQLEKLRTRWPRRPLMGAYYDPNSY